MLFLSRYAPRGFTALESVVMLVLLVVFSMVTLAVVKKGTTLLDSEPVEAVAPSSPPSLDATVPAQVSPEPKEPGK